MKSGDVARKGYPAGMGEWCRNSTEIQMKKAVAGLTEGSKSACNSFPFVGQLGNLRLLEGPAEKSLSERLVMFDPLENVSVLGTIRWKAD